MVCLKKDYMTLCTFLGTSKLEWATLLTMSREQLENTPMKILQSHLIVLLFSSATANGQVCYPKQKQKTEQNGFIEWCPV